MAKNGSLGPTLGAANEARRKMREAGRRDESGEAAE